MTPYEEYEKKHGTHEEWKQRTKRRFKIGGGIALLGFLTAFFGSATYNGHTPSGIFPMIGMLLLISGFVYLFLGIFED
jgi:hypothetical protein